MEIAECVKDDLVTVSNPWQGRGNRPLTCALVPPIPKELTLMRWCRPDGKGVGSTGTFNPFSAKRTLVKL
jgi:hypothetical protein